MTKGSENTTRTSAFSNTNKLFVVLALVLVGFSWLIPGINPQIQNIVSIIGILLLGIPHGAIDNLLYLEKSSISTFGFYIFYLGFLGLNVVGWLLFPTAFFILFLALSAYHFGQSQFSDHFRGNKVLKTVAYFSWGFSVILAFAFFNLKELTGIIHQEDDLASFQVLLNPGGLLSLFLGVTVLWILVMILGIVKKEISLSYLISELLILGFLFLVAHSFSFLPGFALFFVVIHSLKVMQSEFNHFFEQSSFKNLLQFIYKLLPLTVVSMVGLTIFVFLIYKEYIHISLPLLMLIAISSITLPHVFVMEKFYGVVAKAR
jgi:Brp/Blh family beta-carotene 15,15'-monooxygenase